MKIDVIIGHSNTHDSRDRNLKFIVARYQKMLPIAKITIVEQNTESDLSDLNVSHILRKTPEPFVTIACPALPSVAGRVKVTFELIEAGACSAI